MFSFQQQYFESGQQTSLTLYHHNHKGSENQAQKPWRGKVPQCYGVSSFANLALK